MNNKKLIDPSELPNYYQLLADYRERFQKEVFAPTFLEWFHAGMLWRQSVVKFSSKPGAQKELERRWLQHHEFEEALPSAPKHTESRERQVVKPAAPAATTVTSTYADAINKALKELK